MAGSTALAPFERSRRRRAVRAVADLADRARQLQPVGPGVVLQHRIATCRRPTSPAESARSSPSCRSSWSATPPTSRPLVVAVSAGTTSGAAPSMRPTPRRSAAALLFVCSAGIPRAGLRTLDIAGKEFRAGGYLGALLAGVLAEYLNRTGSIILILTLLFLARHPLDPVLVRPAVRRDRLDDRRPVAGAARRDPGPARREAARETAARGAEEASRQAEPRGQPAVAARPGRADDTALVAVAARAANAKPRAGSATRRGAADEGSPAPRRWSAPRPPRSRRHRRSPRHHRRSGSCRCRRRRRCRCPSRRSCRPSARRAPTRSRRSRCSTPRRPSARSTSAS